MDQHHIPHIGALTRLRHRYFPKTEQQRPG
jgi:hypothetical protein